MKLLYSIGCAFALAASLAAGSAFAGAETRQGKEPPTKAERRAARQARKAARQANQAPLAGQSGPNARAGTPRPGTNAVGAPAVNPQAGGQTGANARAGTPRQTAPPALTPAPVGPSGSQSGANARAGTGGQMTAANPPQSGQQMSGGVPAGWQHRLQQMNPKEREQILKDNEKFQSLPKAQQDEIRENLAKWDKLTPRQQASMNRNAEALEKMTPEQRENLRKNVLPQLRTMSVDRRQEINQRLGSLNGLSDAERNQKLSDPNFYQGLSPQEHDVLKQLGEYKLTPGAGGE
ncbi:MAG TPA: DUF3106 domain-containing protein [Candidatus Solibacter sp.]|nr:DUF3106 domain-containing protein [Candidatus Solibacter sp.]